MAGRAEVDGLPMGPWFFFGQRTMMFGTWGVISIRGSILPDILWEIFSLFVTLRLQFCTIWTKCSIFLMHAQTAQTSQDYQRPMRDGRSALDVWNVNKNAKYVALGPL
jgi:hypothetical protein